MTTTTLERAETPLIADVEYDDVTAAAVKPFDLAPEDHVGFYPWVLPALPHRFRIGLIVGASGSGKSLLLREFGGETPVDWQPRRSIVSHVASAEEGAEKLYAVGLNSVPAWRLPYDVLSNGQKFRADLARRLGDNARVDEFTSVVDRNVAVAASKAVQSWAFRMNVTGMVFASCHRDIVPWLMPDWVIDTDSGEYVEGEVVERPHWWEVHVTGPVAGAIGLGGEPRAD
jgi:ABC-type ATPase with predicted acetyltransferase domain